MLSHLHDTRSLYYQTSPARSKDQTPRALAAKVEPRVKLRAARGREACGRRAASESREYILMTDRPGWRRGPGRRGAGAEVGLRAPLRRRVVIPLFILPPEDEEGGWPMGGACRLWLHKVTKNGDLNDLQTSLVKHKQTSFMFV